MLFRSDEVNDEIEIGEDVEIDVLVDEDGNPLGAIIDDVVVASMPEGSVVDETIDVLDADGRRVMVNGRGFISSSPNLVVRPSERSSVLHWAGPWPVDERWWDPARRRRRARFQLVTAEHDAVLVVLESGQWWLEARYA